MILKWYITLCLLLIKIEWSVNWGYARCNDVFITYPISFCRCDADPVALAKYVVALLRKEKPKSALKDLCIDQLEVFLSKGVVSCSHLLITQTCFLGCPVTLLNEV